MATRKTYSFMDWADVFKSEICYSEELREHSNGCAVHIIEARVLV